MTHEEIFDKHSEDGEWLTEAQALKAMAEAVESDSKELVYEITEMQKYWDENGYECTPVIKLQRIHQNALASCSIYQEQLAAKDKELEYSKTESRHYHSLSTNAVNELTKSANRIKELEDQLTAKDKEIAELNDKMSDLMKHIPYYK